jgi:GNAT superfamily N-acetyltransferase
MTNASAWDVGVTETPVHHAEAVSLLRVYFIELVSRYYGRVATEAEVDASQAEDPSDGLVPPGGLFLLAWRDDVAVGCIGLRTLTSRIAEVKRMFVRRELRGRGVGSLLLDAVEHSAREREVHTMRLDTRGDLVEARSLYAKHGYVEIAPYSESPYAEHWFEKHLV